VIDRPDKFDKTRPLGLARKARLRFDARSGKHVLLYPERGLELSPSAARIVEQCAEGLSAAAIVDRLAAEHPDAPRATIEADVMALLAKLDERGLLVEATMGAPPSNPRGAT
jgi:coenzyme PQQ biosynthesis protein PqqD